jgi:hypothetical protein
MDFKLLIPLFAATFAAIIGFYLNQVFVHHREKKSRYQKIISLLKAGQAEVEFNHGKLVRLKEDLTTCLQCLKGQSTFGATPSYDLLPNFLDRLKGELVAYPETSALVKTVGNMFFEAVHIQKRVDFLTKQINGRTEIETTDRQAAFEWNWAVTQNTEAILRLIELNLQAFQDGLTEISNYLAAMEKEFNSFLEISPFYLLLRD